MLRLVEEGKIRAAGVCNFNVEQLKRCDVGGHVNSLQTKLSLIAREATNGLIQWCEANETGVLAYSPMHVGLLTDSFQESDIDRLAPDDWRRRDPEFLAPRLQQNLAQNHGRCRSDRVGSIVAGCERRNRGRPHPVSGERLDRRASS
jgi:aryl-alcohol dehydrogenase-like predicted oxidoreductase